MKRFFVHLSFVALLATGFTATSCKSKNANNNANNPGADTATVQTAPVEVSNDAALQQGVTDATKDFPGVTATVSNGEINVAGEIKRSDWQTLMPRLQGLNPKKVNSDQLTIK